MPANKVRFEVCGAQYITSTTDSEAYVMSLAAQMDEDMKKAMELTPSASVTAAAVITALGYLDEMKKTAKGMDNMREQIKEYLQESSKAKAAAEETQREVERLRHEVNYLTANRPQGQR
ncbi:MAG: cell division protein ZapA [Ruthenibacterium sp.]